MFMFKTGICVVYVNDCLFWARSQSDIDNTMNYFKQDGPSYNCENSKGELVSEFLGIHIKTSDNFGFQFYQTGLIHKVLEATVMDHCNGFLTPTKFQADLGIDTNVSEDKIYWPNSYVSFKGMMLYLASNTSPDISFVVHRCARFTHNSKASHETDVNRICWYL